MGQDRSGGQEADPGEPAQGHAGDEPGEGAARPDMPFRPPGGGREQSREVARPDLPDDVEPDLPPGVRSGIRQSGTDEPRAVAVALAVGAEAIEADQPEAALEYLRWARQEAPRSVEIREALGVALYRAGRFRDALAELRAYRRLSGRQDQNHLIGDCLRGLERPSAEVADDIQAMLADEEVAAERRVEGVIVWAGSVADEGDVAGARSVLRNADDLVHDLPGDDRSALARLWYMEGDLAERAGETEAARRHFRAVVDTDAESFDARERLERLAGDQTG